MSRLQVMKRLVDKLDAFQSLGQQYSSQKTSRSIVPGLFADVERAFGWKSGTKNFDIGGGKFDRGTTYLAERGVENLIFDPYNRGDAHNASVVRRVVLESDVTATCSNVLNVIQEPEVRAWVVEICSLAVDHNQPAYFAVYYDRSGKPGATRDGWQEHRPLKDYRAEISPFFRKVEVCGSFIRATGSTAEG